LALRFAVAFAVFEAVMPLVGLGLGAAFSNPLGRWAEAIGAFALVGAGVYVVVCTLRGVETSGVFGRTWVVFGLPMSLSIDNLAAGFGLGVLGMPVVASAVTLGVISGAMCFAAFRFGGWITHLVPARIEALGGLALFAIAASSLVGSG
jgi:putative Mn2+ efflux pump MntP